MMVQSPCKDSSITKWKDYLICTFERAERSLGCGATVLVVPWKIRYGSDHAKFDGRNDRGWKWWKQSAEMPPEELNNHLGGGFNFQIFFIFIPIWGRFPFWLIFLRWVGSTTNQSWTDWTVYIFRLRHSPSCSCQVAAGFAKACQLPRLHHPRRSAGSFGRMTKPEIKSCLNRGMVRVCEGM